MSKKRNRNFDDNEPIPVGEDWIQWGTEMIQAVGYTSGGAPFGITESEFRKNNEYDNAKTGWVHAKRALESIFRSETENVEIGWVKKIGAGLSRDIFAAHVDVMPDLQVKTGAYAVLLPRRGTDPQINERTQRETKLLKYLTGMNLPFRVPCVAGLLIENKRLILVRSLLAGMELDLRAGRQSSIRPWQIVGEIAAAIHRVDYVGTKDFLPGFNSRRAHAEAELAVLDSFNDTEIEEARVWLQEHLPPDSPSVLLHGDLLGQNILLYPEEPPGVIDWEYARGGDPAYDFAIVTRGHKKPFQIDGGRERLIEAYMNSGGIPLIPSDIYFYEIILATKWYRDALAGNHYEPAIQALERLKGIVRRAVK